MSSDEESEWKDLVSENGRSYTQELFVLDPEHFVEPEMGWGYMRRFAMMPFLVSDNLFPRGPSSKIT